MLFPHSSVPANYAWMQSYYDICGNTPLDQAEVIILTDIYNDQLNVKRNVACVNQIWQEHLVLVEEIPFGQRIQPNQHPFSKGINKKATIHGWDHPEFKGYVDRLNEREEKIDSLAKCVLVNLQAGAWGLFLSDSGAFANLLAYTSKNTEQKKREIRKLLDAGMQDAFALSVRESIEDVKRDHQKLVYELFADFWQSRLNSLKKAIKYGTKLYNKVIVLVSGSFVIPNPRLNGEKFDLKKITSYLEEKKFAILNAKHSPLSIVNQPELWPQLDSLSRPSELIFTHRQLIAPVPRRFSNPSQSVKKKSMPLETINGTKKNSSLFILRQELSLILEEDDESESISTSSTEHDNCKLDPAKVNGGETH